MCTAGRSFLAMTPNATAKAHVGFWEIWSPNATEHTMEGRILPGQKIRKEPLSAPAESFAAEGAGPEYMMYTSKCPIIDLMSNLSISVRAAILVCEIGNSGSLASHYVVPFMRNNIYPVTFY